ncbi:MAG: MFS transporter [Candidatus Lokiarchaeota archaeon]|nr:MFS transporter [Candidatus Harpocratesius repetitus]
MRIKNRKNSNKPFEKSNPTPKSSKSTKSRGLKMILNDYKPILYFIPLIILISSDDATLLVNEVLIIVFFQLENNLTPFGILLGVSQITKAISLLIFGYLADKFQRKKLLLISSLCWAISDIMISFSESFVMLFTFRVLSSAFAGAAASVILSLLADSFSSDDRGMSFAIWTMISTIGIAIGGMLCSAFNKVTVDFDESADDFIARIANIRSTNSTEIIQQSWQTPFLVFGLFGLGFIFLAMFFKEPKRAAKEKTLADILAYDEVDYSKFYSIKLSDLKYIWKRKTNFFLVVNFFDTILAGMLVGYLIMWISVDMGFDVSDSSSIGYLLLFLIPIIGGLIWGNFFWPKRADEAVKKGKLTARVRTATFLGWVHLPFLLLGFAFIPNYQTMTLFKGAVETTPFTFGVGLTIMGLLIGIGMSFEMAVGPLHYSSMVDVNLPEHRSTMIAAASFMDAIGRALGTTIGAVIMDFFIARNSPSPISETLLFSLITFGVISGLLWLPIYKYANGDFTEVSRILQERKEFLKQQHGISQEE